MMSTRVDSGTSSRSQSNAITQGTAPSVRTGTSTTINAGSKPSADVNAGEAPSSGGGGGGGGGGSYVGGGGSDAAAAAAAAAERAAAREAALKAARDTQSRKKKDSGIAMDTFKAQREREAPETTAPVTTQAVPRVDAESVSGSPKAQARQATKAAPAASGGSDYYELPSGRRPPRVNLVQDPAVGMEYDEGMESDIEPTEWSSDPIVFAAPNGSKVSATTSDLDAQRHERERRERDLQNAQDHVDLMRGILPPRLADVASRQRAMLNARGTMKGIRDEYEAPINARMRQQAALNVRNLMDKVEQRYRTPGEIRDAVESYVTTPARGSTKRFEFEEDAALNSRLFPADASDEEMLKKFRKTAEATNKADVSEIRSRRESPETSIDRQANGYVNFDPNTTERDVVRNTERSIDSTAMIYANPLLVKIEGQHIERTPVEGDTRVVEGKLRWLNKKGRDVEGAIGMVRREYGCSVMSVLRLVYGRLGLSVDTHNKICGKSLDEFVLPADVFIEACNDIVKSQKDYGIPIAIVDGIPGGFNNSRDDTGMFPVLGGTRCYPLGMVNLKTFDDLRRDPNSPLHGMSATDFYQKCQDEWINRTQPSILANTTGPLAYQASALNTAMRAVMSIDGARLDYFNISEQEIYRTRAQIQAQRMEAGDRSVQEAFDAKMDMMPTVLGRWARMNFKDSGSRNNGSDGDGKDPVGAFPGPGSVTRRTMVGKFLDKYNSVSNAVHTLWLGVLVTSPVEGAISTAQQQVVVSMQNMYRNHISKKANLGNRFDKTDYLRDIMSQEDAIEAIEALKMLYRIGGRTAVDAFRMDRNDTNIGTRYNLTKQDAMDFLQRWGSDQGSEIMDKINKMTSMLMIGDGMFNKTKSQQFLDMALFEMAQREIGQSGEVLDNADLEEIARSGEFRNGAGEALVNALIDTAAGYEAFKTMDATSLARTNPWTRATTVVLKKNSVIDTTVRALIGRFPEYGMNYISRMIPLSNTFSYLTSNLVKKGAMKSSEAVEVTDAFTRGYKDAADAISRISDYQIGMDSVDFMSGLYKNLAYDVVSFGGNYILMGALSRTIIMLLGGLVPPDDPTKKTLASEWVIRGLGVPVKAAWFMDDIVGCGLPLAYAWILSDGWDEYDQDGNVVRHVDAGSDEATGVASSVFINTVSNFLQGNFVVDAIDFVNNFDENFNEIFRTDVADEVRAHYGDDAADMSDADLRREWAASRVECVLWDLFGDLTPPILNEILPGTRDSLFGRDGYVHTTNKKYDEAYDRETAKNEWRTKDVTYAEHQRLLRTQDNVLSAFLADLLIAKDGIEYQYQNMPIDTVQDPRNLGENSFENLFALPLTLDNGSPNVDLTGPDGVPDGKTDSAEERQEYLFGRAEEVCKTIYDEYILAGGYPETAVIDGFYIPFDARLNAINYCYYMQGKIKSDINERKKVEFIPEDEYQTMWDEVDKYKTILNDYLNNEDIPWRAPRYAHLETDRETMYVDQNGNATNALDPSAQAISYEYGNDRGMMPFVSPRDTGMFNYNTKLWDVMLDENGEPMNDLGRIWEQAENAGTIPIGRWQGNDVLEQMASGNGPHDTDRAEQLAQQFGDLLTLGYRSYEPFEGTYPDWLKNPDADTIARMLGIASYIPGDETEPVKTESTSGGSGYSSSYSRGGRSYYSGGGGYSYYSSGGSYSNAYNPKIYSNARQVNGDRASGLSTRQPYKATNTYLRPNFYTKGSREAYKRSDI